MKLFFIISIMFSTLVFGAVPILKPIIVQNIFTPQGFDSNDSVEVVVTGILPNLCHKSPQIEIKKSRNTINVNIKSLYYSKSNPYCPEMVVPFQKVVSVGNLESGTYNILVNQGTPYEKQEDLNIIVPKDDNIDNYQYAYIDTITEEKGKETITLSGYNPSDCYQISKVEYISNGEDTYSILPRMEKVSDFCPMKLTPFSISWDIPKNKLSSKNILLHVRTLNGNSINKIINNRI